MNLSLIGDKFSDNTATLFGDEFCSLGEQFSEKFSVVEIISA